MSPYPGSLPWGPHDGTYQQTPVVPVSWAWMGMALIVLFLIALFLAHS
jgi:hypothetical protein